MTYRVGQRNYSKGVLAEELYGRSDIVPYHAALREGRNIVLLKQGGFTKRPGTRFVYEVKDGTKRMLPFEGAYEASYVMLMGQASMRLPALGGMVLETKLTVEAVALTDPVEITASYHGFATGDEVYFSEVSGATWLNGRIETVTVTGTHTFTIPVNGVGREALSTDAGGIIRSAPPTPPPPPPPVPPPPPPPPPPATGGGGGNYGGGEEWNDSPGVVRP